MLLSLRYDLEQVSLDDKWFAGIRSLAVRDGPLDQVQAALEDIAQKIQPQSGLSNLGGKLLWLIDKKEIDLTLQRIERMKGLITLAYSKDTL